MMAPESLSDLIGSIYDCAIDPSRWPGVMEAIRTELDCQTAVMSLHALPDFRVILTIHTNVPAPYARLIDAAGPDVAEQWGGSERIGAHPIEEPAVLSRVNPAFDPATTTNRYYLDFGRPQGLHDALAVVLARDQGAFGSLAFGRHERAGRFGERELRLARLLVPHLQRAAAINRLLDLSALAAESFSAVIDRLAAPIVLVEAGLRIVHANPAAAALVSRADPLIASRGVLRGASAGVDRALAVAVESACTERLGMERKGLEVPARSRDGDGWVLHVLPLATDAVRQARAAIFVGKAHSDFAVSRKLLSALFSLTPAEARVFEEIAAGYAPRAVAERLGVAPSTIKTHIKRLYQKTGASGHAELGRIASSLASPIV